MAIFPLIQLPCQPGPALLHVRAFHTSAGQIKSEREPQSDGGLLERGAACFKSTRSW